MDLSPAKIKIDIGQSYGFKTALARCVGDSVHCCDTDETLIGKIHIPDIVANICFGGPKRNTLFDIGSAAVWSLCKAAVVALRLLSSEQYQPTIE